MKRGQLQMALIAIIISIAAAGIVIAESLGTPTPCENDTCNSANVTIMPAELAAGQADLDTAKASAAVLTEATYTPTSWGVLTTALALPEITNAEVVTKTTAINSAIAALVVRADNTALTAAINAEYTDGIARTTYVLISTDYTGASWTTYTGSITAAVGTEGNRDATPTDVTNAITAIGTGKAALMFAGAADLTTAKAAAATKVEADYTPASWTALTSALALPEITNAEVVTKTTAINSAIAGLVLKADKSALTAAINAEYTDGIARTTYVLISTDYTGASWTAYIGAIAAGVGVEGNGDATPTQISDAIAAIGTGKAALVFAGAADLDTAKANLTAELSYQAKATRGQPVLITALIRNEGTTAAANVRPEWQFPDGFEIISESITCGSLAPGDSCTVTANVNPASAALGRLKAKLVLNYE
jgi:2-phospho-L-lactate guanylyltransferase (CobY/MobA/RfbA family)